MTWGDESPRSERHWIEVSTYLVIYAILAYALLSDPRKETPASNDTGASIATVTAVTSPTEDPSNYRGN